MKSVVGYCEPLCATAGDDVALKLTCHVAGRCQVEVTKIICGDLSSKGPGFQEHTLASLGAIDGREQPLQPGSSVEIDPAPELEAMTSFTLRALLWPTRPGVGAQAIARTERLWVGLDADGALACRIGRPGAEPAIAALTTGVGLAERRWVMVEARYDAATGNLSVASEPLPTHSPADLLTQGPARASASVATGLATGGTLVFGGSLDGKLEAPELAFRADATAPADVDARWDFAQGIGTTKVFGSGALRLDGHTVQGPARAVTGAHWTGETQRWSDRPDHYAAIHFHRDDLIDAGWATDATWTVPADLPSGFYAFKVTAPDGDIDRTPFFVRPPTGTATAPLAFLVPTATYYAYANHRMTISGAEFFPARNRLRPEFQYIQEHPQVGYSHYEYHDDQSGVMYSSRKRPILNLKPGADGWAYSADTNLIAFLEDQGIAYDVVTDDDLHREGRALLDRYQAVMSGSHPEYWSTAMEDALESWLADGGRFVYLGGNGLYWRVAWSDEQPWVMEVRRAEDGTRGWIAEAGEYYHEYGGEYGGLWRRLGRAPNKLVGVGFAAQGFDRATYYRRTAASNDPRAAWIFDGVTGAEHDPDIIGDYGVGGGAAGQEIDRWDPALGSPTHALVLASSENNSHEMLRTKEEFLATMLPWEDPKIRADVVFFELPNGGAVFSTGSIAWYGALAHRGYDNDIARMTANVLRRFVEPEPFPFS